jgi:hypothetical protein
MGDVTGTYVWLLIPIYGNDNAYCNAIAFEATGLPFSTTGEGSNAEKAKANMLEATGSATYFFRAIERNEYTALATDIEELDARFDTTMRQINEMMLAINFRREPIYLSEEKLNAEPQYARYRYAIQKVPSLRSLRKLFIGRVVHSSFDQWKNDVRELLQFNSTASDDRSWEK